MAHFTRLFIFISFLMAASFSANAQLSGDYRSKATGNWSDFNTWQIYDGTTWNNAISGQVPGGTGESDANNVYLEAGFTVTLNVDASCKDLHLNTTQDVIRINTSNFPLNVWGKMRFYEGIAPGAGTPNPVLSNGVLGWITTGANGYIRFRGTANRVIMVQGEVNANNFNSGWNFDFQFENGFVGEVNDRIRAGSITVTSGELFMNNLSAQLRVGTHSAGDVSPNGSCIIRSGATVRGGEGIFKSGTTAALTVIVEDGGTLVMTRSGYILAAVNLTLDGTVILENTINFPTPQGRGSAVPISTFTNLTLGASGGKALQNNVTVNGTLKMAGTASLSLNTFVLTYGSAAELEYNGSTAQTTKSPEFPISGGPNKLTINNPNGVTLHADRTVEGQFSLTAGILSLGNFNLTLGANSPTIGGLPTVSNMIATTGTGELRKIFNAAGNYFFPIGEASATTEYSFASITVNSADAFDGTTYIGMRVIDMEHPADAGSASHNLSRYWKISSNMTNVDYGGTLQYMLNDVINDESYIFSYIYSDETSIATGNPISSVNSTFHRIALTNQTNLGYITGSSFCKINNNAITAPAMTQFCSTVSSLSIFDANTVSSGAAYQWQQSIDAGAWNDITANSTNEDYTEPSLLTPGTYWYRRVASDPSFCLTLEDISDEIMITVLSDIFGNNIGNNETVTIGGDPAMLMASGSLSGGTGVFSYQWKSSTTQGGPYTNVAGAGTTASFDPPSGITQTTYYVREVSSGACTSTSNEVTISVGTTGLYGSNNFAGITMYPNPASKQLFVDLDLSSYKEVEISILSSMGEIMYKGHANPVSKLDIDLSSYASGFYFAQLLLDGKKTVNYKFVKE